MCTAVKLLYLWSLSRTHSFVLILNLSQICKWKFFFFFSKTQNVYIYTYRLGSPIHPWRVKIVQRKSSCAIYWVSSSHPFSFALPGTLFSLIPCCAGAASLRSACFASVCQIPNIFWYSPGPNLSTCMFLTPGAGLVIWPFGNLVPSQGGEGCSAVLE